MKSAWNDMTGFAGLGLSGSLLRTLKSAGSALEGAERVNSAIRRAGIGKTGAGLGPSGGGMKDILGTRLKDSTGVGATSLLSPAVKELAFGGASRPLPAFSALPDLVKGASALSGVTRASDLAGVIPRKRAFLGFPETMFGAGAELSVARASASFLQAGIRGGGFASGASRDGLPSVFSALLKDLLSGGSPGLSGWLGAADLAKRAGAWRDVMDVSAGGRLFGPPRGLDIFGIAGSGLLRDASPALGAFEAVRRASGSGLGGLLDAIGRIDLEALREAERVREARRPRTRIGFAAIDAYDELYMGHPWVADRFLLEYLGIRPTDDRREALWRVLREAFERTLTYPARWIMLDDERAAVYLRAAVYNGVDRIEADRERRDRVWWTARDPETKEKAGIRPTLQPDEILELMMRRSGNPADIVVPPPDERGWVLEMLYLEGSEQDRRLVAMIIAGYDLAAIAHVVGWPEVQRFQRKAQRWRRIRLDRPPGG